MASIPENIAVTSTERQATDSIFKERKIVFKQPSCYLLTYYLNYPYPLPLSCYVCRWLAAAAAAAAAAMV